MERKMAALHSQSLRDLMQQVNDLGIQKEDIVTILDRDGNLFLLYYK